MPLRNALCALVALFVTASCSQEDLIQKIATPEDQKTATECLERLRTGDVDTIEARMDPSLKTPELHQTMLRMAAVLPDARPDSVTLVGAQVNSDNEGRTANLTYQYGYGERWYLVNCATKKVGKVETIVGISVNPQEKELKKASFELKGKSATHYGVLLAAVVFVLLSLGALIACVMERGLRRKWAWILFIIFGIGQLTFNWDTGESSFSLLSFLLFSAGTSAEMYGDWTISIALPLGAMWYIVRRFLNHRPEARSNPV